MAVKCKITGKQKVRPTEKGACPECTLPDVKLTGKGFVAAHNALIVLGDGPQIPVTDEGTRVGDPRDAAVRREIEGTEVRVGKADVPSAASPEPVMTTGHGRGPAMYRGRSMPPIQPQKGYAAAAGTMAGAIGRERTDRPEMVGGHYGYLEKSQYERLSRTQQRKYWARVSKAKAFAAARVRRATSVPAQLGTGGAGSKVLTDGRASQEVERLMQQPRS